MHGFLQLLGLEVRVRPRTWSGESATVAVVYCIIILLYCIAALYYNVEWDRDALSAKTWLFRALSFFLVTCGVRFYRPQSLSPVQINDDFFLPHYNHITIYIKGVSWFFSILLIFELICYYARAICLTKEKETFLIRAVVGAIASSILTLLVLGVLAFIYKKAAASRLRFKDDISVNFWFRYPLFFSLIVNYLLLEYYYFSAYLDGLIIERKVRDEDRKYSFFLFGQVSVIIFYISSNIRYYYVNKTGSHKYINVYYFIIEVFALFVVTNISRYIVSESIRSVDLSNWLLDSTGKMSFNLVSDLIMNFEPTTHSLHKSLIIEVALLLLSFFIRREWCFSPNHYADRATILYAYVIDGIFHMTFPLIIKGSLMLLSRTFNLIQTDYVHWPHVQYYSAVIFLFTSWIMILEHFLFHKMTSIFRFSKFLQISTVIFFFSSSHLLIFLKFLDVSESSSPAASQTALLQPYIGQFCLFGLLFCGGAIGLLMWCRLFSRIVGPEYNRLLKYNSVDFIVLAPLAYVTGALVALFATLAVGNYCKILGETRIYFFSMVSTIILKATQPAWNGFWGNYYYLTDDPSFYGRVNWYWRGYNKVAVLIPVLVKTMIVLQKIITDELMAYYKSYQNHVFFYHLGPKFESIAGISVLLTFGLCGGFAGLTWAINRIAYTPSDDVPVSKDISLSNSVTKASIIFLFSALAMCVCLIASSDFVLLEFGLFKIFETEKALIFLGIITFYIEYYISVKLNNRSTGNWKVFIYYCSIIVIPFLRFRIWYDANVEDQLFSGIKVTFNNYFSSHENYFQVAYVFLFVVFDIAFFLAYKKIRIMSASIVNKLNFIAAVMSDHFFNLCVIFSLYFVKSVAKPALFYVRSISISSALVGYFILFFLLTLGLTISVVIDHIMASNRRKSTTNTYTNINVNVRNYRYSGIFRDCGCSLVLGGFILTAAPICLSVWIRAISVDKNYVSSGVASIYGQLCCFIILPLTVYFNVSMDMLVILLILLVYIVVVLFFLCNDVIAVFISSIFTQTTLEVISSSILAFFLMKFFHCIFSKPPPGTVLKTCQLNDIDYLSRLLQRHKFNFQCDLERNEDGLSPLLWASENGKLEIVTLLLDAGYSANETSDGNITPLHLALDFEDRGSFSPNRKNRLAVARRLLDHRANPGIIARFQSAPQSSHSHFNINYASHFISRTPFHLACRYGHTDIVRKMLDNGYLPSSKYRDYYGLTPLLSAVEYGHLKVVEILLKYDCDVKVRDPAGATSLHYSASRGSGNWMEIFKILLKSGKCNIDEKNNKGNTALHGAVVNGSLDVIQLLIQAGSDPNVLNVSRNSPIFFAPDFVISKMNTTLLHTDDPSSGDLYQNAVLSAIELIQFLLVMGSNIHSQNSFNRNIIQHFNFMISDLVKQEDKERIESIFMTWEVTMTIIVLQELCIYNFLDMSSFLDLFQYVGTPMRNNVIDDFNAADEGNDNHGNDDDGNDY